MPSSAELEHQVWATPPGEREPEEFAAFAPADWQWAEKMARYLQEMGMDDAHVRRVRRAQT